MKCFYSDLCQRFPSSERESVEAKMKRLEAQYASFQIVSVVSRYGDDRVSSTRSQNSSRFLEFPCARGIHPLVILCWFSHIVFHPSPRLLVTYKNISNSMKRGFRSHLTRISLLKVDVSKPLKRLGRSLSRSFREVDCYENRSFVVKTLQTNNKAMK